MRHNPAPWPILLAGLLLAVAAWGQEDERRIIGGRGLEIHYWPEQEEIATAVRATAQADLKLLAQVLRLDLREPVRVDIVRNHAELVQRAGTKLPAWTLGISRHHANHIILKPLSGKNMERLVRHELTHVALDRMMARTRGEAPRWLHEGLALWMEGELDAERKTTLGEASARGKLLKLAELESAFDGPRERVDLAYAQSYTLVAFIVENGPPGALGKFLQYLMDTGDDALALQRAMGQPLDAVERRWLDVTRQRYVARGVPLTVDLAVLGAMGVLFILAVVVKLRQARAIRERMQEEEALRQLFHGVEVEEDEEDQPMPYG